MPNTINKAAFYAEELDAELQKRLCTSVLEKPNFIKDAQAGSVYIPSIAMDGLGDYSRSSGYPAGDVTYTWTQYTLTQDRGRSFSIDTMDEEESKGAFKNLVKEYERVKVAPEVDLYRFTKLYTAVKAANKSTTAITAANALTELDKAIKAATDNNVDIENCYFFVSATFAHLLRTSTELIRVLQLKEVGEEVKTKVLAYNGIPLIEVPASRFYTLYSKNASTGEISADTVTGKAINFFFVPKECVIPVAKHAPVKIFSPEVNQDADAWKYQIRLYHDIIVPTNKADGLYVSHAA